MPGDLFQSLIYAIEADNTETVRELYGKVNFKDKVDHQGKRLTFIEFASCKGSWESVIVMAEHKSADFRDSEKDEEKYGAALLSAVNALFALKKGQDPTKQKHNEETYNKKYDNIFRAICALLKAGAGNSTSSGFGKETDGSSLHAIIRAAAKPDKRQIALPLLQLFLDHVDWNQKDCHLDLRGEDKGGAKPIHLAASSRCWECVDLIMNTGKINSWVYGCPSALLFAVIYGHVGMVRLLSAPKFSSVHCFVTETNEGFLHRAVRHDPENEDNRTIVALLLSSLGCLQKDLTKENDQKQTPIELACSLNHWVYVEQMAAHILAQIQSNLYVRGAGDPAGFGSVLLVAVREKKYKVVDLLLKAKAPVLDYENGDSLKHQAVRNDDARMFALLHKHNVSDIHKNNEGLTPQTLANDLQGKANETRKPALAAYQASKNQKEKDFPPQSFISQVPKMGVEMTEVNKRSLAMVMLATFPEYVPDEKKPPVRSKILFKELACPETHPKITEKNARENITPLTPLDTIFSFLDNRPGTNVKSTEDMVMRGLLNAFLEAYKKSTLFSFTHSSVSQLFVARLQNILKTSPDVVKDADAEIKIFCETNKENKNTIGLLKKHKLYACEPENNAPTATTVHCTGQRTVGTELVTFRSS